MVGLGGDKQVSKLPTARILARSREPTDCRCNRPVVWRIGRWMCASPFTETHDECTSLATGCTFEMHPPPCMPPLCDCGQPAAWVRRFFLCEADRCDFELRLDPRELEQKLEPTPQSETSLGLARCTAAHLTAVAYGPMNPWSFVSPCDAGLGLFARVLLLPGQCIGEYGGPRLPAKAALSGTFVLEVPGTKMIIDVRPSPEIMPAPTPACACVRRRPRWIQLECQAPHQRAPVPHARRVLARTLHAAAP